MALQSDFMIAVNQVAAERNLDADDILDAVKQAIKTGYKNDYAEDELVSITVEINEETGGIEVYADKKVVEEVTDSTTQISVEEAQKLEPKLRDGDHVEIDVTPDGDFGRVAAQTAKQVILQKLRESEKEAQIKRFVDRIGEIETGIVQRMDGDSVIWEIGRTTAIMPNDERIQNEFYRRGTKHKILLKEIRQTPRGKMIILSRADNKFLEALFNLEVPELLSETIEIKSVAREAGQRSKVAVKSNVEGVDPIGSCVGQRGVRIMAIMNELKMGVNEEKIDIILWDESEEQFVINALSPAQVVSSEITDLERKIIRIIVPDEQLSLAIGKDGQNVRLAAKLTGWNIDIQGETIEVDSEIVTVDANPDTDTETIEDEKEVVETKVEKKTKADKKETGSIENLELSTRVQKAILVAGVKTVDDLKEKIEAGEKIKGVGPKAVEEVKAKL